MLLAAGIGVGAIIADSARISSICTILQSLLLHVVVGIQALLGHLLDHLLDHLLEHPSQGPQILRVLLAVLLCPSPPGC